MAMKLNLTTLRRRFSISSHGTTLKQLIDIGEQLNLSCRPLQLDMEHLPELQLPCILHWELNHFVVLTAVNKSHCTINDPAIGERKLSLEEVAKYFSGIALEAIPTKDFVTEKGKSKLSISQFWNHIVGLKHSLVIVFILSVLLQIFALITPFYLQTIVDDVILRSDRNLLWILAIGFGVLLLIRIGTSLLREFVILHLSNRMNIQMAANVFRHLIRLPMDYFSKRHIGDIVSRFGSLQTVRELFTTQLVAALIDGLLAIFTLIVMFFYNTVLAFVVLGVSVLYLLLRLLLYKPVKQLTEESIVTSAKENTHFIESIRAIQTIKLFQKENDRQSQWQNKLADSMNKNIFLSKWNVGFDIANQTLFGIENIIVIFLAALLVMDNLMSIGMLFAFISYKDRFIEAINKLIATWIDFKMLEVHLTRLADIIYTEKEDNAIHSNLLHHTDSGQAILKGEIQVKDLSYGYSPNDPLIFENLNFHIKTGETVAIVGSSGCGKTTLLKCMMGLLQPTSGSVLVDNHLIKSVANYRQSIAGVMQDDQLLSGSIADNIACFDDNLDMEKIVYHSQLASIHQEIMAMPMQYSTLIGDMGDSLSGGQKQRIILARALYRNPKILFMDEATSHLDIDNERLVNENIMQLSITRIIVAHRPETIRSADRVINLFDNDFN